MVVPTIKPYRHTNYETKQSKYAHVPKLPCRMCLVGKSGSGKSVVLQNLCLDIPRVFRTDLHCLPNRTPRSHLVACQAIC